MVALPLQLLSKIVELALSQAASSRSEPNMAA
jgi:hypothetical protein